MTALLHFFRKYHNRLLALFEPTVHHQKHHNLVLRLKSHSFLDLHVCIVTIGRFQIKMCSVCGYLHLTVGTRRLWAFNFLAQQQIGWENTLGRGVIVYALKITLDQIRDTKNGARRILWNLMPQWNMHNLCSVGTFTRNALYSKICNSHTFPYSQNGQKVEFQPKKSKNAFFSKIHREFFRNFN